MRKTIRDIEAKLYLATFVIPKGTEVRELPPSECPALGSKFVVADPLNAIPGARDNPILRHDLTHHYLFVSEVLTERA